MLNDVNLNLIATFVSVAQEQSFTRSSHKLGLSQPSVTRQIRELEEQLQAQLFVRDRHRVMLSRAGKFWLEKLEPAYRSLRQALADPSATGALSLQTLRIGALSEIGQSTVYPVVLDFMQKRSNLSVEVQYLQEAAILEKLKEGTLDFGTLSSAPKLEQIRSYRLFREKIVVVSRSEKLLSRLEEAIQNPKQGGRGMDLVAYRQEDPLLQRFKKKHSRLFVSGQIRPRFWVNSHRSMIRTLEQFDILAVLPYQSARLSIESHILKFSKSFEMTQELHLAQAYTAFPNEWIKDFLAFALKEFKRIQL